MAASGSSTRTCTPRSQMVIAPTLGGCGDGCFSETAFFGASLAPAPARPGQDHRLAGGHDPQLVVVAGPVRRRSLADELGEAGGEGAQAGTANCEADIGHALVAA